MVSNLVSRILSVLIYFVPIRIFEVREFFLNFVFHYV